jgi:isopentenyl diphosphate isomerase/L-lactate dehydrogenase-like FMN-dependent dehydrogenase
MTRREAFKKFSLFAAGSPLMRAQLAAAQQPYLGEHGVPLPITRPDFIPPLEQMADVFDFEAVFEKKVSKAGVDLTNTGVDDEWTLRRDREAFENIAFRPRMLTGGGQVDLSVTLFGQIFPSPIFISPTGTHSTVNPEGEPATARGAFAAKTLMIVSNNSSYPIDKIGQAAKGTIWFQLYPAADGRDRVQRAVDAGCKAICITVDNSYTPHRERILRGAPNARENANREGESSSTPSPGQRAGGRRASAEPREFSPNLQGTYTGGLTWKYVEEVKSYTHLPVLVKGLLTPEDALEAVRHGADGVIVSNHGARYLDFAPSTIEALPGIVDAVAGKIPVLVDSGFRRGSDVLKALAMGAKAVGVGRPVLWGLGAYGSEGVTQILQMVQTELARTMGLSGRANLASIDRTLLQFDRRFGLVPYDEFFAKRR